VLISARGRLFSVGGDLAALASHGAALPVTIKSWTADLHAAIVRMVRMRAPVVIAVQGNVAGGSVSLMAAGDLVVIGKSARISSAFAKIGFTPDSGSTTTVTRRIGVARARRFFLLAERWTPTPRWQRVGRLCRERRRGRCGGREDRARTGFGPHRSLWRDQTPVLQTLNRSIESQLEDEAQTLAAISRTADAQEGVKSLQGEAQTEICGKIALLIPVVGSRFSRNAATRFLMVAGFEQHHC